MSLEYLMYIFIFIGIAVVIFAIYFGMMYLSEKENQLREKVIAQLKNNGG